MRAGEQMKRVQTDRMDVNDSCFDVDCDCGKNMDEFVKFVSL